MLSKYYNGTPGSSGLNSAEINGAAQALVDDPKRRRYGEPVEDPGEYAFGGKNEWDITGFHRPVEGLTAGELQDIGLKFFLRRLTEEAARLGETDLPDNFAQDAIAHKIGELMMTELRAGGGV